MQKFAIVIAALVTTAAVGPAVAAEAEAVVAPGPFDAPPAFPARRVYDRPVGYEPAVVPDYFAAHVGLQFANQRTSRVGSRSRF